MTTSSLGSTLALMLSMAWIGPALAASGTGGTEGEFDPACVLRLELPGYSNIARSARMSGVARAEVKLGTNGMIEGVTVTGVAPLLKTAVKEALIKSKYSEKCGGRLVSIEFRFTIVGEPKYHPNTFVSFMPPNVFVIATELNEPMPQKSNQR